MNDTTRFLILVLSGFIGIPAIACSVGWLLERVERCHWLDPNEPDGGPTRRRDPARDPIHAAICEWCGIRTPSVPSTASTTRNTGRTFPKLEDDGQPGPAHGRAGRHHHR